MAATFFTPPQLSKLLTTAHGRPVSAWSIRQLLSSGRVPFVRVGVARCVEGEHVPLLEEALGLVTTQEEVHV